MSDCKVGGSNVGRKRKLESPSSSDSESSDDSLIVPRKKGPKGRVISESSDSGSEVETRKRRRTKSNGKPVIISESDSDTGSIGDGLACPICLGKLEVTTLQGQPESCEHTFCFECIIAWSKNNTTCPLCRTSFTKMKIILRGDVLEELPVEKATPDVDPVDQFLNDILCLVCNRSDQEDSLLLCDECDDAYHCACLNPPLMSVPPGQWFCPRCSQNSVDGDSDDELFVPDSSHSFHVPRTRATERVRRAVQSTRRTATSRRSSGTTGRRRRTATIPKTSARARTATGRSRKYAAGKRRKTRRKTTRRRKGGRRLTILRKAYAASTDHQLRIAQSLGLSDRLLHKLNRNNVSFPVLSVDEPSTSRGTSSRQESLGHQRPLAGLTPSLRIFGSIKDYVPQEASSDDDRNAASESVPSRSEAGNAPSGNAPSGNAPSDNAPSGLDFLDGLLQKQSVLFSKQAELKRDTTGKLRLVCNSSSKDSVLPVRASSTSAHSRPSVDVQTSATSPKKSHSHSHSHSHNNNSNSNSLRATTSSLEYDVRYKPHRISRLDPNCVAAIADTIEHVVKQHRASSQSPQGRGRDAASANSESTFSRLSSVSAANERHNILIEKTAKESQGWINSLRLTVPTVINSLNVFQDDVDVCQLPSGSSSNLNASSERYFDFESDHVRVKQEPIDADEHHAGGSGGGGSGGGRGGSGGSGGGGSGGGRGGSGGRGGGARTGGSNGNSSRRYSFYDQDDNKKRSHHSDYKRDKKRERFNDRKEPASSRRSYTPDLDRNRSSERNRSRRKSRSRSPLAVKRERSSRERTTFTLQRKSSDEKRKFHPTSRSRSRERLQQKTNISSDLDDVRLDVKRKASYSDRRDREASSTHSLTRSDRSKTSSTLSQHGEPEQIITGSQVKVEPKFAKSAAIDPVVPPIDLTRVKLEPVELYSPTSSCDLPASAYRTLDSQVKQEKEEKVMFDSKMNLLTFNTSTKVTQPSEDFTLAPAEAHASATLTTTSTTTLTTTLTTTSTTTSTSTSTIRTTTTAPTTTATTTTATHLCDAKITAKIPTEPSDFQPLIAGSHSSQLADVSIKTEELENVATLSNNNSSAAAHIEGYSSGMDSEESFSDVEKAVPQIVAYSKPVVEKESPKYVKYFVAREKFKDAVIQEVGPYLKKFYKKHQISKEDYKEIFKKVVKKVCTSSSERKRLVCTKAIHKLCHVYVKRARIQIKLDCKFGDES